MYSKAELYTYIILELFLLLLLILMLVHNIKVLNHSHRYRLHRRVLYFSVFFLGIDILRFHFRHSLGFEYSNTILQMADYSFYSAYLYCVLLLFLRMQKNPNLIPPYSSAGWSKVIFVLFLFVGIPAQAAFPGLPVLVSFLTYYSLIICLAMDRNLISRDPLTGLYNRSEMARYMEQRLRQSQRKSPLYLVLLDLDGFKTINDTYGHTVGDQVLILFADTLRELSINYDGSVFLSRYGGDEFLIVLESNEDTGIDNFLMELSGQLQEAIKTSCQIGELTVSSGYARLNPEARDTTLEDLIGQADRQMYQQKNHTM